MSWIRKPVYEMFNSTFLKAIQIFQTFYDAWTLCNLISGICSNKVNKYDKERINCSYSKTRL